MTDDECVKELQSLIKSREYLIVAMKKKHVRASEKAMTMAAYTREIEALTYAIKTLDHGIAPQ
jgi:hypothetical protein